MFTSVACVSGAGWKRTCSKSVCILEHNKEINKDKNKDETGDNDSKTEKTDSCEDNSDKSNKKKAKKRKQKNMENEDDAVTKKQHIDETDQGKGNNSC